ncbi:MAG: peptide-N-glycosidase F-related protein [Flavobacteriales bacterium]
MNFDKSTMTWMKLTPAYLIILAFVSLGSCSETSQDSDHAIVCMDDFHIFFDPDTLWDELSENDGWVRWDNGRLLTQSFAVPHFHVRPSITAHVTLRSAGDPWDKSGSLMLLPNSKESLLDVGFKPSETDSFPGVQLIQREGFPQYLPPIELLRFITPFGVGHFSNMERLDEYRPVYIPEWEDSVRWEADISHLWEAMKDTITLGVYIDTWTHEGYKLDMDIQFEAQPLTVQKEAVKRTISLVNTTKFGSEQRHFDGFAEGPLIAPFELNEDATNAMLHYTVTGHGGHAEGDEFVPSVHDISWNGDSVLSFTPWRSDCASFRRLNPSSGVWMERTYWKGDSLDERIASSDLSRTGWCPGSMVEPVVIPLGDLKAGQHELKVEVPTAQSFSEDEMNFWNVGVYLTYEFHE